VLAAGGVMLGLLAARFLKASSTERYESRSGGGVGGWQDTGYSEWERQLPPPAQLDGPAQSTGYVPSFGT